MSDKIKAAARKRMAETGEPYTVARRNVIEERARLEAPQAQTPAWTENEDGPDCACGNPTVVKIMPDGKPVLVCFFHTSEAGMVTPLPAERPAGWGYRFGGTS